METLQNNFTTPEQSKRLLELGVPKDSADCYINTNGNTINVIPEESPKYSEYCRSLTYLVPCWSLGRLIEIYNICLPEKPYPYYPRFGRYENMMVIMLDAFVFTQGELDFSKLEE